jgi:hypothetical protein
VGSGVNPYGSANADGFRPPLSLTYGLRPSVAWGVNPYVTEGGRKTKEFDAVWGADARERDEDGVGDPDGSLFVGCGHFLAITV